MRSRAIGTGSSAIPNAATAMTARITTYQ